jgi:hypothetical protein
MVGTRTHKEFWWGNELKADARDGKIMLSLLREVGVGNVD